MSRRLQLLWVNMVNSFRLETAYRANFWLSMFNTITFNLAFILLIEFVYYNVDSLAGYGRNEMLFIMMVSEAAFYLTSVISVNIFNMAWHVNKGTLDYILVRPLPALWFLSTERIQVLQNILSATFVLGGFSLLIDWSAMDITLANLLLGLVVFVAGVIAIHVLHFIFTLTVFWFGYAHQSSLLIYSLSHPQIPFEGMSAWFKTVFVYILPTFLASAVAVSAMLGNIDVKTAIISAGAVGAAMVYLKLGLWRKALKTYTSASS